MRKLLARFALLAAAALALTGCAAGEEITVSADTVIIDVRTPAEYATGHLEGALNIDVQATGFDEAIQQLDPDADYVVYCRSGSRAAAAITRMAELGYDDAVNAGSVQDASDATGIPIVQ